MGSRGVWPPFGNEAHKHVSGVPERGLWVDAIFCLQLQASCLQWSSFTYTIDNFCFFLTAYSCRVGAFSLTISAYLLTFFAYNGKSASNKRLKGLQAKKINCKQRNPAVCKRASYLWANLMLKQFMCVSAHSSCLRSSNT